MRKTIVTIVILGCLMGEILNAQEVKVLSLQEANDYALQNDLDIKNARLNIEDADQQIIERRSVGLPQVNGAIDYSYYFAVPTSVLPSAFEEIIKLGNNGQLPDGFSNQVQFALRNNLNFGLSANSLIFDGSYLQGLKAARLFREYVGQELIVAEQNVKDKVRDAYLPALLIHESLVILDSNIVNLEKMFDETKEIYEAGFVEQLDVDRLELSLANLKTEKESLIRQKQVALDVLKFTIGYRMTDQVEVSDRLEDLLKEATADDLSSNVNYYNHPEYKVADLGIRLNELNEKVNKAAYYPSVGAFASYQYGYQGNKLFNEEGFWAPNGVIGLNINVPIFDGFGRRAKMERAKLQTTIAKNQQSNFVRAISLELQVARTNYLNAKERVLSQQKNLSLAEKIYKTTQIKYKEGVGSSIELTQAEQALYQTQLNLIQARYDLLVAKTNLDKALGN